ncbi:hypothetical protein AM598_07320, partial [Paenibacillus polymyxa]
LFCKYQRRSPKLLFNAYSSINKKPANACNTLGGYLFFHFVMMVYFFCKESKAFFIYKITIQR